MIKHGPKVLFESRSPVVPDPFWLSFEESQVFIALRVKCEIGFEKPWAHCGKAGNLIDVRTDLKQDKQQPRVQKVGGGV